MFSHIRITYIRLCTVLYNLFVDYHEIYVDGVNAKVKQEELLASIRNKLYRDRRSMTDSTSTATLKYFYYYFMHKRFDMYVQNDYDNVPESLKVEFQKAKDEAIKLEKKLSRTITSQVSISQYWG